MKAAGAKTLTLFICLLILSALIIRALTAYQVRYPQVDGICYMEQARQLLATGKLPFSGFPPGWPLIIALVLLFFGSHESMDLLRAAQIANVLLGTGFGLLAYYFARTRLATGYAVVVAVVVFFLPHNIFFSKIDMSEMAYGCAILGVWLLWDRKRLFGTGLLLGYAYLIRPEALLVAAGIALFSWYRRRAVPWRFAAGVLLFLAPYVLFIWAETGQLSLTGKAHLLERTMESHTGSRLLSFLWDNIEVFYARLPGLLGLPITVLFLLGVVKRPGRWLLLLLPLLIIPFFPIGMRPRFWLPYLPIVLLGAVLGWRWLAGVISRGVTGARRRVISAAIPILACAGLVFAVWNDAHLIMAKQEVYPNLKDAGLWLKDRVQPATIVASYKRQSSFWASCGHVLCPDEANAKDIIATVRTEGAEYLVVDVFSSMQWRRGLLQLLRDPLPADLRGEVTLLKLFIYDADYRMNTAIYRIERTVDPEFGSAAPFPAPAPR